MSTEDAEAPAEEGEETTKTSPRKPWLKWIVVAVVILMIAAGGFIGFRMVQKRAKEKAAEPVPKLPAPVSVKEAVVKHSEFGNILPLEPFVANLSDTDIKRLLRMTFELELAAGTTADELNARMPQLRDTVLMLISSKNMKELQAIEGKIALRNELIMRINKILTKGKIRNIYFTEFVIQ